MAKILGKPGKVSGNPSGPGEFEQEFYLTNKDAAALLRDLAQEIEAGGRVEAVTDGWSLSINPMPSIKVEVQYKSAKKELEVQFKLKEMP